MAILALLNDRKTQRTVAAERRLLGLLNGGCQIPIGAYAVLESEQNLEGPIVLHGMVASPDGNRMLKESVSGVDSSEVGSSVAEALLRRGADDILAEARE